MADTVMTSERVRELLLQVWGEQACQHPADWPDVLDRLLKNSVPSEGGHKRASLKPAVDEAVVALAAAFRDDPAPPLTDPIDTVWRAFPKLDRRHCAKLAALLIGELQQQDRAA